MAALQRELRRSLERMVVSARAASEEAARAAIATLAVKEDKPHPQMSEDERRLRRALRAKSRQLGGNEALIAEIAYQHWHRMLFARFLAENGLLIYPGSAVAVSLQEVAELAKEEREADPWNVAARFAAQMLPAIFRSNDPVLEIRFAPEGRQRLEALLSSVPKEIFTADDSLGWVYQFWQSQKWKDVNKAGGKIGAAELPAVTQLFTEDYIVRFLLENSLGAWWAARHPQSQLLKRFQYLRFVDGTVAAGAFAGWPATTDEITVMDPCCGSGHFLTVAFEMLVAMRMEEEGLSSADAGNSVIGQNLFGLEIDPRCTQIAAFALALSAWKRGGYRELPAPNIACSGIGVASQLRDWKTLAAQDARLEQALEALYEQFRHAPDLGSLIDPHRATDQNHLFSVNYEEVAPLLQRLLSREQDPEAQVAGWAAAGSARAASLLARSYTLIATNVPYLARGKQDQVLADYCERHYSDAKHDLATIFVDRCKSLTDKGGSYAVVTPQHWLQLGRYKHFRVRLLRSQQWDVVASLGSGAFEEISGEVVNIVLVILSNAPPCPTHLIAELNARAALGVPLKDAALKSGELTRVPQSSQLANPDSRVTFTSIKAGALLKDYSESRYGLRTADSSRLIRCFWELTGDNHAWRRHQSTVRSTTLLGGREHLLLWEDGRGALSALADLGLASIQGRDAWGKRGVAVSLMGMLPCTLYSGDFFDNNCAVIWPRNEELLPGSGHSAVPVNLAAPYVSLIGA